MIFPPIAQREFRVASRRAWTFRVRWITAAAGALLAFAVLAFTDVRSRTAGTFLYSTLTFGAFLFAVGSGPFLAAASISEERREGTLGLLFLTPLSGWDIVAGKLLIVGLNALLALASVVPVFGLAWILGGVTGAEVGRMSVALVQTLLFSLTVSVAVSAGRRNPAGATAWSGAVLTAWIAGGAILLNRLPPSAVLAPLRWILDSSPWILFRAATDAAFKANPGEFWTALASGQCGTWFSVAFAAFLTQRTWKDADPSGTTSGIGRWIRFPSAPRRPMSPDALETNPVLAWRSTRSNLRPVLWILCGFGTMVVVLALVTQSPPAVPLSLPGLAYGVTPAPASVAVTAILLLLKVLFAWQSCEFWTHGRRTGELEILLSTPLRDDQILDAQWILLRKAFFSPLSFLITAVILSPVALELLPIIPSPPLPGGGVPVLVGMWSYQILTLPLELMAIAWMGAWIGLSSKRPGAALGRTVLLVIVLPAFFFCLPTFLVAGVWFGYARNRMSLPIRDILQDEWRRRSKRKNSTPPDPQALYEGLGKRSR
ncbi:MAG: ABC transporter permease [Verrucomicrobiota bacterium]